MQLGLIEVGKRNLLNGQKLLRFVEAGLHNDANKSGQYFQDIQAWCGNILPVFEGWALEVIEIMIEYGLPSEVLTTWYRNWVSTLLNLPIPREQANLESWLAFGEWMQGVDDLILRLRERLAETVDTTSKDDPISKLTPGFRIGIFTLRQSSAKRVAALLLARNSQLDIRLCHETDLNDQARSIATNSNMVVIVTTCISHALTYGIGPYVADPVYPASSGSSAILQAIQKHLSSK